MDTQIKMGKRVLRKGKRKPNELVIDRAAANGIIHKSSVTHLQEARTLYVIEGYTIKSIAVRLGIPRSVLDRWILVFGWDAERRERMNQLYIKHGHKIAKIADSLGIKADEVAHSLMSTLEDTAISLRDSSEQADPKELSALVKALKDMFSLRKEIHKATKPAIEVMDSNVSANVQELLNNIKMPKNLENTIVDADYDIINEET